jgi:hypothetical protein
MAAKADSVEGAFDLYASRYWALRKLWETDERMESPVADPDLKMVEPDKFDDMSAPMLVGAKLPSGLLKSLYIDAAQSLLEPLHSTR